MAFLPVLIKSFRRTGLDVSIVLKDPSGTHAKISHFVANLLTSREQVVFPLHACRCTVLQYTMSTVIYVGLEIQ